MPFDPYPPCDSSFTWADFVEHHYRYYGPQKPAPTACKHLVSDRFLAGKPHEQTLSISTGCEFVQSPRMRLPIKPAPRSTCQFTLINLLRYRQKLLLVIDAIGLRLPWLDKKLLEGPRSEVHKMYLKEFGIERAAYSALQTEGKKTVREAGEQVVQ